MWWIPIFWYLDRRRLLFWTIWCLLFWNRRKIERLTQFPKKLPPPPLFSDIFQFSTIWDFFFEIASIAQCLSDIKKEGIKLFGRAIPFYPDTKIIGNHHIRGGEPINFHINHFLGVSWKFRGSPTNVVDTIFFGYLSIRKSLFQTISCNLFQNQRKIEKVYFFF